MKKIGRAVLVVVCWFVVFGMVGVAFSNAGLPDNTTTLLAIIIATLLFLIPSKLGKASKSVKPFDSTALEDSQAKELMTAEGSNISADNSIPAKLPSEEKCREIVYRKVGSAKMAIDDFHKDNSILNAHITASLIRTLLNDAIVYEEKADIQMISDRPSCVLQVFEREYQWKLRDVIEREEAYLIGEMKGAQRNNKRACCGEFYEEIQDYKETFSEETLDFAMDAYYRVCEFAGLTPQSQGELVEGKSAISDVDEMEGHEFEEFCADLLRKNGFKNVETTRGSGDQGVDILAEKDGIKYAIQCKCYSSDLGNKPIQEVFAGKSIYNCHIACVMTNRYFTPGGLEASKATGVLLWDRRKLQEFIENANKN